MPDFTAGGIHTLPAHPPHTSGNPEIDKRVRQLVADFGCDRACDLIEEMIITALKIGRDRLSVADLKLFNRSLKELRHAARVFAPYISFQKVVVFGSARIGADEPSFKAAEDFARKMREHDYMIITGGGDGIMGAAQRGAGREHSFGLNIRLPFEQRANETIYGDTKLVNFNYFFTRKLNFVKETHAVALFPGGFGTMDEGFEVLTLMQTGKGRIMPLVLVDRPGGNYWKTWFSFLGDYLLKLGLVSEPDFSLFSITDDVDVAVNEILQFYRNFVSYRWVGKRMVIRIRRALTEQAIGRLNQEFSDIFDGEQISQGEALPQEKNEPELAHLPRLLLSPFQREFGRLRRLLDAINNAETVSVPHLPPLVTPVAPDADDVDPPPAPR
jgi:uncharacterized protein (TIGR00730 family)